MGEGRKERGLVGLFLARGFVLNEDEFLICLVLYQAMKIGVVEIFWMMEERKKERIIQKIVSPR